jgi:hypothetical protein
LRRPISPIPSLFPLSLFRSPPAASSSSSSSKRIQSRGGGTCCPGHGCTVEYNGKRGLLNTISWEFYRVLRNQDAKRIDSLYGHYSVLTVRRMSGGGPPPSVDDVQRTMDVSADQGILVGALARLLCSIHRRGWSGWGGLNAGDWCASTPWRRVPPGCRGPPRCSTSSGLRRPQAGAKWRGRGPTTEWRPRARMPPGHWPLGRHEDEDPRQARNGRNRRWISSPAAPSCPVPHPSGTSELIACPPGGVEGGQSRRGAAEPSRSQPRTGRPSSPHSRSPSTIRPDRRVTG